MIEDCRGVRIQSPGLHASPQGYYGLVLIFDGTPLDSVMVHCTHSHSGPGTGGYIGWGEPDPPYLEVLPGRIASACLEAVKYLRPCTLSHGTAPCEGIGYNRVYDEGHDKMQAVHDPGWRPEKPELTDTGCHVFTAHDRRGRLLGFASSFGCHPVVGGASSRCIHGDFTGIATNIYNELCGMLLDTDHRL